MGKGKGLKPTPVKTNINDRANGKARKQKPRKQRKTGRTVGGYSPAKLAERAKKRAGNVGKE
jgi:hypothetical protein